MQYLYISFDKNILNLEEEALSTMLILNLTLDSAFLKIESTVMRVKKHLSTNP